MTRPGARIAIAWIAVAFAFSAWAGEPGKAETPQATAAERLAEAKDLWRRKGDHNGALAAFNEAVELAPENIEIRLQRAVFFEQVVSLVVERDREKFKRLAREDLRFVADADPDSVAAGIARDGLGRLDGRQLFPEESAECPEDATRAYAQAESLFHQGQYEQALKFYGVATAACPANAPILVAYADAYYGLQEYPKAKAWFLKALDADRWNRGAHRFLADTEIRLGNKDEALRQAALAVVSDPTYEAAWALLRGLAGVLGRDWKRVYAAKPYITEQDNEGGDDTRITVTLKPLLGDDEEEIDQDLILWTTYGLTKATAADGTIIERDETGEFVSREIDPKSMSPAETERQVVESTLSALRVLAEVDEEFDPTPGPFWTMMDRAAQEGFLDEAIFLHLMDAPLVDEYIEFREANEDRLVEYLETLIVPVAAVDARGE